MITYWGKKPDEPEWWKKNPQDRPIRNTYWPMGHTLAQVEELIKKQQPISKPKK